MHYENYESRLFRDGDLGQFLRERMEKIQLEVGGLNAAKFNSLANGSEAAITNELLQKYSLNTPVLGEVSKVHPQEADIEVPDMFDRHETHTTKGFHITVEVPFNGDAELFQLRASTYSGSGVPAAAIHKDKLVLTYQTVEKDPEKIKQLWLSTIEDIKKNLEWTKKDVADFNQQLQGYVAKLVAARVKESGNNQSVMDQIKLG